MNNRDAAATPADGKPSQQITRRLWLQGMACTAAGVSAASLLPDGEARAQAPPLADVIRSMSAVTGEVIEENWVGPTASLVRIILDYSKGLRALDLGEVEPATDFLAR